MKTKTLLVPIDFSAATRPVVAEASRLARRAGARLVFLHVIQPPAILTNYDPMLGNVMLYMDTVEKDADRSLARLHARLRRQGLSVAAIRTHGLPVRSILEQARQQAADYIVMGSHGQTAFYDLLTGSTTSGVLRRAACPVIVVPVAKRISRRAK